MSVSRERHLDSLRGIAALIVVVVHYLSAFYPYTVYGTSRGFEQHAVWEKIFFFPPFGVLTSGHLAVSLFFILSGYVLSYRYLGEPRQVKKILASILKRPVRLGGLVWFAVILCALMWNYGFFSNGAVPDLTGSKLWLDYFWVGDFNVYRFLLDFTESSFSKAFIYDPPLWTIKFELYGSIMVYLFLLLTGDFKYRILVSILLIIFFESSLYEGFWLGVLVADVRKNYTLRYFKKFKGAYCALFLILFLFFSSYPYDVDQRFLAGTIYSFLPNTQSLRGGYPMIAALSVFVLVVSSARLKKYLSWSPLHFMGNISYGVYAIHFLVLGSLSARLFVFLNNYMSYGFSFLIVFLSGLPVIIFLGYLATIYVDYSAIKLASYISKKATSVDIFSSVKKRLLNARQS